MELSRLTSALVATADLSASPAKQAPSSMTTAMLLANLVRTSQPMLSTQMSVLRLQIAHTNAVQVLTPLRSTLSARTLLNFKLADLEA